MAFLCYFRLFIYGEDKRDFSEIGESNFHDHCVLSVKHVIVNPSSEKRVNNTTDQKRCYICSTATDGKIVLWDITRMLFCFLNSTSGDKLSFKASGASANCDTFCDSRRTTSVISEDSSDVARSRAGRQGVLDFGDPLLVVSCHQSGINAVDIYHVEGLQPPLFLHYI